MSISEYLDNNMFSIISDMSFSLDMYKGIKIIGLGAGILNGLSYEPIEGNVTVLSEVPETHKFNSGLCRMYYIEGYDTSIGFEDSNVASAERVICDYIKYKDIFNYYDVFEFIEFYGDEYDWDFSKIYDMAEKLGIEKSVVCDLINDVLENMGE